MGSVWATTRAHKTTNHIFYSTGEDTQASGRGIQFVQWPIVRVWVLSTHHPTNISTTCIEKIPSHRSPHNFLSPGHMCILGRFSKHRSFFKLTPCTCLDLICRLGFTSHPPPAQQQQSFNFIFPQRPLKFRKTEKKNKNLD